MGIDEVASARARRAAARLEEFLAELEAGEHDLPPERVEVVSAHIRLALEASGRVTGRCGRQAARPARQRLTHH